MIFLLPFMCNSFDFRFALGTQNGEKLFLYWNLFIFSSSLFRAMCVCMYFICRFFFFLLHSLISHPPTWGWTFFVIFISHKKIHFAKLFLRDFIVEALELISMHDFQGDATKFLLYYLTLLYTSIYLDYFYLFIYRSGRLFTFINFNAHIYTFLD